jgi:hypothetical protein
LRLLLALILVASGLLLGLGDAFLAWWNYAAGGASDIRARGPWLLVLYLPYFAVVTWVATQLLTLGVRRRYELRISATVLLPLLATAGVMALFYLEPTGTVWRVLVPLREVGGTWTVALLDAALLAGGIALLASRPASEAGAV